jgi:hypothetical protein
MARAAASAARVLLANAGIDLRKASAQAEPAGQPEEA